jgi:hypothetical protein
MNWGESFQKAIAVDASPGAASQSFFTMNVSLNGVIYASWLDGRERGKGRAGTAAVCRSCTFQKRRPACPNLLPNQRAILAIRRGLESQ